MPKANELVNRLHPIPPPPLLGDGPMIPEGTQHTTRAGTLDAIGTGNEIQRPDLRRPFRIGSGDFSTPTSSENRIQGGYNTTHPRYLSGSQPVSLYSGSGSPLVRQWRQFVQNQPVEVNVQGQGWVVGAVVAMVHVMQAFGSTVKVKFRRPQYHHDEEEIFANEPGCIRPRQNPGH